MCGSAPRVHTPRTYEHVPYEMTDVYVLARGAPGRRSTGTADPRACPRPPRVLTGVAARPGAGRPTVVSRRGVTYGYGYRLRWPRPLFHNQSYRKFTT